MHHGTYIIEAPHKPHAVEIRMSPNLQEKVALICYNAVRRPYCLLSFANRSAPIQSEQWEHSKYFPSSARSLKVCTFGADLQWVR